MTRTLSFIIIAIACMSPVSAHAKPGDWSQLENFSRYTYTCRTEVLSESLQDIPGLFENFFPAGAKISGRELKSVPDTHGAYIPKISFDAQVKYGIIFATVHVVGKAKSIKIKCAKPAEPMGHSVNLDLRESDEPVTANVSNFRVDICYTKGRDGLFNIQAKSYIQEGPDYGKLAGPIARDLIMSQGHPLLEALNARMLQIQSTKVLKTGKSEPGAAPVCGEK